MSIKFKSILRNKLHPNVHQAKPCIKPSKKQLRRHLSSAELTSTVKAERDNNPSDHHSQQGGQRPQSLDRS